MYNWRSFTPSSILDINRLAQRWFYPYIKSDHKEVTFGVVERASNFNAFIHELVLLHGPHHMGNILALLNILFIGDLQNDELVDLFNISPATTSVDRVELLGSIKDRVTYLYRSTLADEVSSISSNSKVIGDSHWLVAKEVYRILSNMEIETRDNINCLPLANIVLVGTPKDQVFLTTIHVVSQMIKSHNALGHPTKVQLVVTNLQEIAVI